MQCAQCMAADSRATSDAPEFQAVEQAARAFVRENLEVCLLQWLPNDAKTKPCRARRGFPNCFANMKHRPGLNVLKVTMNVEQLKSLPCLLQHKYRTDGVLDTALQSLILQQFLAEVEQVELQAVHAILQIPTCASSKSSICCSYTFIQLVRLVGLNSHV